jgi:hypothetical protein
VQVLRRAIGMLGFGYAPDNAKQLDYQALMREALRRIHLGELQLREATSLEELDIGRSVVLSARAEIQQLIRTAKRERGIAVRPIAETEQTYQNMLKQMGYRVDGPRPARRRTGTGR